MLSLFLLYSLLSTLEPFLTRFFPVIGELKNTDIGGEIYDYLDNQLIYIFFLILTAEEYEMLLEIEHLTEVMDKLNRIIRQHAIANFKFILEI